MRKLPYILILVISSLHCFTIKSEVLSIPPIQLATKYQQDIDVTEYLISEKLDGVRGYWDGSNMLTRY